MKRYFYVVFLLLAVIAVKAQTPDTAGNGNKKDRLILKTDSATEKRFRMGTPKPKKETVYHPDSNHSPHTAVIRSLMLPGLGQIYNRHGLWWRLPALYTGIALLAYNIYTNGKDYNGFLAESEWRANGRPPILDAKGNILYEPDANGKPLYPKGEPFPYYNGSLITNVSDATIYAFKDNLRRNRDLSAFGLAGVWLINAVDAYVEAKFIHSYTMDDNLSFKVTPSITGQPVYASNFNSTFTPALKITFFLK